MEAASDSMRQFLAYHRRMLLLMGGVCLAISAALALAMRGHLDWAGGFAAGAAAQLLKFGWLDVAVVKKIAATREKAATTQLQSSFFSLLVFGAALFLVYKFDLYVWTFVAGVFLPRVILIADTYIRPNPFGAESPASDGDVREEVTDA